MNQDTKILVDGQFVSHPNVYADKFFKRIKGNEGVHLIGSDQIIKNAFIVQQSFDNYVLDVLQSTN